jgi:riboflavin synthase alpha subunit
MYNETRIGKKQILKLINISIDPLAKKIMLHLGSKLIKCL